MFSPPAFLRGTHCLKRLLLLQDVFFFKKKRGGGGERERRQARLTSGAAVPLLTVPLPPYVVLAVGAGVTGYSPLSVVVAVTEGAPFSVEVLGTAVG